MVKLALSSASVLPNEAVLVISTFRTMLPKDVLREMSMGNENPGRHRASELHISKEE
jgi:hypothetical protein